MARNRCGIRILDTHPDQRRGRTAVTRRGTYYIARPAVWKKTQGKCYYCGVKVTLDTFTVDHYQPLSAGGTHHYSNLVPACYDCNQLKADNAVWQFRKDFHAAHGTREFYGERGNAVLS